MRFNVNSEIGRLKKVMLHRPGNELENLTPDILERLLFDDIPWLELAQEEHDQFAQILRENGIEVVYLEDLAEQAISVNEDIKKQFIEQFIIESGISKSSYKKELLEKYLYSFSNKDLILKTMSGIRKKELLNYKIHSQSILGKVIECLFEAFLKIFS